jgi:tight adherence protein C
MNPSINMWDALKALLLVSAVSCGVWAISAAWLQSRQWRLRLPKAVPGVPAGRLRASLQDGPQDGAHVSLLKVARPFAKLAQPSSADGLSRFRLRFLNAGWRSNGAAMNFFAIKALLAMSLPLMAWLLIQFGGFNVSSNFNLWLPASLAVVGYYGPNLFLQWKIGQRQRDLFEAFPDALDLMMVCMEAGLTLDQALQRTGQEMAIRSQTLADELALVAAELRVGSGRDQALHHLALRTGLEEIRIWVHALRQADRFGTAMVDTLRVYAEEFRIRRQLRAEEAAAKVPTQLLFPLLVTIFPALFVVLVGPAALGLWRHLAPMLRGA